MNEHGNGGDGDGGGDDENPMIEAMRQQIMTNGDLQVLRTDLGRAYQALNLLSGSAHNGRKEAMKEEVKVLQSIVYDIGASISALPDE